MQRSLRSLCILPDPGTQLICQIQGQRGAERGSDCTYLANNAERARPHHVLWYVSLALSESESEKSDHTLLKCLEKAETVVGLGRTCLELE